MNEPELYARIAVALVISLGVGIERGYRQRDLPDGQRATGIRTFVMIGLVGLTGGLALPQFGPWLVVMSLFGLVALLTVAYQTSSARGQDIGLTTEMAALATFLSSALSGAGQMLAAAMIGVAVIVLLHARDKLHNFVKQVESAEIDAALKVLAIGILLLPLAPNQGYGPGGVLNPYLLIWALVIIAGLGLVGYASIKILGPGRGALGMGFFGGLVSSTGVTISAAKLAGQTAGSVGSLAATVGLAQAVMFTRTAVLVFALNPQLFYGIAPALAAGGLAAAIGAWIALRRDADILEGTPSPGNPDTITTAVQFVVLTVVVLLIAQAATAFLGSWGLYASSLVAGLVDADAATVTASRLAGTGPSTYAGIETGGFAVILGLTANSLSKTVIAWQLGGKAMGTTTGTILCGSALMATVAFVLTGIVLRI